MEGALDPMGDSGHWGRLRMGGSVGHDFDLDVAIQLAQERSRLGSCSQERSYCQALQNRIDDQAYWRRGGKLGLEREP